MHINYAEYEEKFLKSNHRTIVVSYKNFDFVKNKYPSRKIEVTPYCNDEYFIVMRKYPKGTFMIKVSDLSVWVPDTFPYFRKKFKGVKNELD